MDDRQQTSRRIEVAAKIAVSLAVLFPVYALLYLTFPASIIAIYLISAGLLAAFAPWDKIKQKFLS